MSSVLGLNGLHADGSKVSGFKSIIVNNFKGIGLQKDNNAFVKYNATTGGYDDSTTISNIHNDGNAKYKPAIIISILKHPIIIVEIIQLSCWIYNNL